MKKIHQINCGCKLFCHLNNFREAKKILLKFSRAIHTQAKTLKCHLPTWNIYFLNYQSGKRSTLAAAGWQCCWAALVNVGWLIKKAAHCHWEWHSAMCRDLNEQGFGDVKENWVENPMFPLLLPTLMLSVGLIEGWRSFACLIFTMSASRCYGFLCPIQGAAVARCMLRMHHPVFSFLYPLCAVGDISWGCRPLTGPQLASVIPSSEGHEAFNKALLSHAWICRTVSPIAKVEHSWWFAVVYLVVFSAALYCFGACVQMDLSDMLHISLELAPGAAAAFACLQHKKVSVNALL